MINRLLPFGWGKREASVEGENAEVVESAANTAAATLLSSEQAADLGSQNARELIQQQGRTELVATVAELTLYKVNTWQITLSNGQTWRQQVSKFFPS